MQTLCKDAWFEPQAAYSCFAAVFKHKATFCSIAISTTFSHHNHLDDVIITRFFPEIKEEINSSNNEINISTSIDRWSENLIFFRKSGQRICIFPDIIKRFGIKSNKDNQHQPNDNAN